MLDFFTDPYKDELIYSAIARYHYYSGNVDFRDTIEECFGKRTMIPTLEIGGNFEYLSKALGKKYDSESLIAKQTILPYYLPFIDEEIKKEIIGAIKFEGSSSIYTKLGIVAGGICKKAGIFYCSICAAEDIREKGEPYIHREHQLEGILLCPHHGMLLEPYPLKRADVSRLEYIRFREQGMDLKAENIEIKDYEKHLKLAKASYYLLDNNLNKVCKAKIFNRYRYLLYKKDLLKGNNSINQRKLYEEFISYYGEGFLKQLNSEIEYDNEYNWLKIISRKSKRASHPLRHLLFIDFLCEDIEVFFSEIDICTVNKIKKRNEVYFIENVNLKKLKTYKDTILKAIGNDSGVSRSCIRNKCKKEYMYLYRYEKEWLFNNLPVKGKVKQDKQRVDWCERDKQYLKLLKDKHEALINDEAMIRITKGNLAKSLGLLANIEKKIELLPLTKSFFYEVCESTEAFEIRRAKKVIDRLINEELENIQMWKIQRIAGIRSEHFKNIKCELQKYLEGKQVKTKL
ncbi:TnsD family Tn7-like transposition protein [Candidatus Clostridium helianthi]|uniref:TnsD family Tn7-like transposition protein n=1 Tax=Candidatus Clostridium helianthi TaxID=3381660 RepID=A0ABW8S1R4_9CLOT